MVLESDTARPDKYLSQIIVAKTTDTLFDLTKRSLRPPVVREKFFDNLLCHELGLQFLPETVLLDSERNVAGNRRRTYAAQKVVNIHIGTRET